MRFDTIMEYEKYISELEARIEQLERLASEGSELKYYTPEKSDGGEKV